MPDHIRLDWLDYEAGFNKTYCVPAHCSNCGANFEVVLPIGRERPSNKQDCKQCGCRTLRLSSRAWA